jgi:hypothetical protein
MYPSLYHNGTWVENLTYYDERHPIYDHQRYISRELIVPLVPGFHLTPTTPFMYHVFGQNETYCAYIISVGPQGARIRVLLPYVERALALRFGIMIFPHEAVSGNLLQFLH